MSARYFNAALCLLSLCGCALFRGPYPNDLPKTRHDIDDDVANGTDPNQHKPLIDLENLKEENIRRNLKALAGRGPDREAARALYAQGVDAYEQARTLEGAAREQKFLEGAEHFVNAADRWPKTSLEQDALFMAGDCYFFANHYVEANRQYESLVKKYANSRHLDVVEARRFIIAKYWLEMNEKSPYLAFNFTDPERPWFDSRGNALRVYDKIRLDDPTGKLADDATLAYANERFSRREFDKAQQYYNDLITAYPDSEHQFNAHFLGLKATLNSYRGSDYEGSSLDDGEKLIKQMRRLYPSDAAREREFLDRTYAEIRYKKAERLFKSGEYYDRKGEYGGARLYYEQLLREYDDTPFASRVQARLEATANAPPVPPQKLQWLANLFPESDELKPILDQALAPTAAVPDEAALEVSARPNAP